MHNFSTKIVLVAGAVALALVMSVFGQNIGVLDAATQELGATDFNIGSQIDPQIGPQARVLPGDSRPLIRRTN